MNYLVVNRAFNDIDHISPIVYKLLENKHSVIIVVVNEYLNYENDYRLNFLKRKGVQVYSSLDFRRITIIKLFFKLLKKIYFKSTYSYLLKKITFSIMEKISRRITINKDYFLKDLKIDAILFDHCEPFGDHSVINRIYNYAKEKSIITFSLPHGLDVYYNENIILNQKKTTSKQVNSMNGFNFIITNNTTHESKLLRENINRNQLYMLGSARFNNEWIKINDKILSKKINNKFNKSILVFMPQHSQYNVDIEKQINLLCKINEINKYLIFFKPHTRNQNEKYFDKVSKLENVRMMNNTLSSELIDIANAVIVYGSSIVLEATIKKKIVLYPKFLHTNETLFEKAKACEIFQTEEEMIDYLNGNLIKNYGETEEQEFIKIASNPYRSKSILQNYVDFIFKKTEEFYAKR